MTPVEWYYARDNKQMGPVSAAELLRLATAGQLGPDDLVWHEGLTEWASARNVRGLFDGSGANAAVMAAQADAPPAVPEPPAAKRVAPSPPARHLVDTLLDGCRPHFNARFVETTAAAFRVCGSYGLFVAALVAAILAIALASKVSPLTCLLWGAIDVLALLTLHYVAGKCCDALDDVNRSVAVRLSSNLLPNCLAVLSILVGVAHLFGSVASAVETSFYVEILSGVAGFFALAYLAAVALNPAALGVSISPEPIAGEETPSAILFLLKALLRLTPVAFGVCVIYGTLFAGVACYLAFVEEPAGIAGDPIAIASAARYALYSAASLPLVAYVLFLLVNLILSLWRSVLSLPGKLDQLAENREPANEPSEQREATPATQQ
jgi:hypothetical protein